MAFKPATDVVLNGRAYAPGGEPVETMHASLTVGGLGSELLVVGDRVCHYDEGFDPVFEDPVPFTEIDLRYEHAYGGVDAVFDPSGVYAYPRNPVGRGFVVEPCEAAIEGLLLPNLEDPNDPLTPERLVVGAFEHWDQQPMPQGFGWFAKHWQPRILLAGRMPESPLGRGSGGGCGARPGGEDDWDAVEEAPADELPLHGFRLLQRGVAGARFPLPDGRRAGGNKQPRPRGRVELPAAGRQASDRARRRPRALGAAGGDPDGHDPHGRAGGGRRVARGDRYTRAPAGWTRSNGSTSSSSRMGIGITL